MKKITLSKMDLVNEDSLQTLIDNNGLQSIVGGISNIAHQMKQLGKTVPIIEQLLSNVNIFGARLDLTLN